MKKNSLFFLWLGILIAAIFADLNDVYASVTRTRTLGDVGIVLRDDGNYWLFPAAIVPVPSQAIFEWGGNPELVHYAPVRYGFDRWAGGILHLSNARAMTLGAFWGAADDLRPFSVFTPTGVAASQKFDLFYGMDLGSGSVAGLHLARISGQQESKRDPGTDLRTTVQQTRIELGLSRPNLDSRLGYHYASFRISGNDISGHALDLALRYFRPINVKLSLVPFLDLRWDFENQSNVTETDGSFWQIWTGAGLNYQLDDADLLVLGLSFRHSRLATENEEGTARSRATQNDLPFVFGGVESELFSWLKLRLGFQKALRRNSQSNEFDTNKQETIRTEAPYAFSAGLGFSFKRWRLDLSWDPDFLKRGPYFVSGTQGNLFNLLSASYMF